MDTKLINKIKRQCTLMADEVDDFQAYDDIVEMKWDGVPNLLNEDYYVEFIDTTGRDIVQQAVNIYASQRPKWEVLPRGLGDVDTAEQFERVVEWYMAKAAQHGRKRFHSEALIHACKYNKVCAQLEWLDEYSFCVKIYHPSTIKYEYGSKLHWVATVNNVYAVSVLEHWQDFAEEDEKIKAALAKVQKLVDDDEEQRVMYIDYTDDKKRFVYCYPVQDDSIDEDLGIDDDGGESSELILIQDKENQLGFINWAISEGEGDPLLSPLHKAHLYDNTNDSESILRSKAFRIAFEPLYLQEGASNDKPSIDMSGQQTVITAAPNTRLTKLNATPLDPLFAELAGRDRNIMTQSLGIGSVANLQASNVQHSTLQELLQVRLAQLDPYKRVAEQLFSQIAYLMFKWSKKQNKVLKATRMYSKGAGKQKGMEMIIEPAQINLDALHIECTILPNNQNDQMQLVNQIVQLVQAGIPVPMSEFIEKLSMGNPAMLKEEWEKEQLGTAVLMEKLAEIKAEADIKTQAAIMQIQAGIQAQQMQQQQQMDMQTAQAEQQPQGQPGAEAQQQGQPLPSDAGTQGQGFNAAQGGTPPQTAVPSVTQGQR